MQAVVAVQRRTKKKAQVVDLLGPSGHPRTFADLKLVEPGSLELSYESKVIGVQVTVKVTAETRRYHRLTLPLGRAIAPQAPAASAWPTSSPSPSSAPGSGRWIATKRACSR